MFSGANPFMQFKRGHHGEHSFEVKCYLDQWFRRICPFKKKVYGRWSHAGGQKKADHKKLTLSL